MNKIQFLKCMSGIRIYDSFNRGDSSTSLGNADTGQTWATSAIDPTKPIGISSNAAYNASTATTATAYIDCGSPNGTLTYVVKTLASSSYPSLLFRYADANNYCRFMAQNDAGKCWVEGKLSGSAFGGSSAAGYYISGITAANGDTWKLVMIGTSIEVFQNNASKGTLTITQNAANTKHGMWIYSATLRYDSWEYTA